MAKRIIPRGNSRSLESAIDEQRMKLYTATAIMDVVAHALEREFGENWPAKYPEFPRALRHARNMVDTVAGDLELGVLTGDLTHG